MEIMSDWIKKSKKIVETEGPPSRYAEAFIGKKKEVGFYVQDFGATAFTGDSEYEYVTYVKKKHKDDVILALLEKLYKGSESCAEDFRKLMEENGIPCKLFVL